MTDNESGGSKLWLIDTIGDMIINRLIEKYNKQFVTFTLCSLPEMFQVLMDTCKAKYDIKPAGRYILQIVHELLTSKKQRLYFATASMCRFISYRRKSIMPWRAS